jgi:hypothetical protein
VARIGEIPFFDFIIRLIFRLTPMSRNCEVTIFNTYETTLYILRNYSIQNLIETKGEKNVFKVNYNPNIGTRA